MSADVLSRIGLQLKDEDLRKLYVREKIDFYSKILPSLSFTIFFYTISVSFAYRAFDSGTLTTEMAFSKPNGRKSTIMSHEWLFEIMNFTFLALFLLMLFFHKY